MEQSCNEKANVTQKSWSTQMENVNNKSGPQLIMAGKGNCPVCGSPGFTIFVRNSDSEKESVRFICKQKPTMCSTLLEQKEGEIARLTTLVQSLSKEKELLQAQLKAAPPVTASVKIPPVAVEKETLADHPTRFNLLEFD